MTDSAGVTVNAWEVRGEEQTVLALAGHSTVDEIRIDRRRRAEELVKALAITQASAGFEIGSGNGIVARYLADRCARLDCNDISASFLDMARSECAGCENVNFFQITRDYLSHLPSGSYDFGFSMNVFIHFNPFDIYHYLKDVHRLLKPSGLFYFDACTIGRQTIDKFLEHAGLYRADPASVRGCLNFNDPELVGRIVDQVGLDIVSGDRNNRGGWMRFVVRRP